MASNRQKRKSSDFQQSKNISSGLHQPEHLEREAIPAKKRKLNSSRNFQHNSPVIPPKVLAWLNKYDDPGKRRKLCKLPQGHDVPPKHTATLARLGPERKRKLCTMLQDRSPSKSSCKPELFLDLQEPAKRRKLSALPQHTSPSRQAELKPSTSFRENKEEDAKVPHSLTTTDYELLNKIGQGSYGKVYRAREVQTRRVFAIKKLRLDASRGIPETIQREIIILKTLAHPNVIRLVDTSTERHRKKGSTIYLVLPYMDFNLRQMMGSPDITFTLAQLKSLMVQFLEGVRYLHANQVFHRDLKPENILVSDRGILQIADFGMARSYEASPPRAGKGNGGATHDYTALVVTRWYRAPELLLGLRRYTPAIRGSQTDSEKG